MKLNRSLILLAGGKSSRMGTPKGLLTYNDHLWILVQIEQFIGNTVHIGLGFDYEKYLSAIPWFKDAMETPVLYKEKKVRVYINPTPNFGLFSNLQNILKQLDISEAVFVLPIDVPLINKKEQEQLFLTETPIAIPIYKNSKGHPVKLSPLFWKTLLPLSLKEKDARLDLQIKKRNASEISLIQVSDAYCILNLNTPSDWDSFHP